MDARERPRRHGPGSQIRSRPQRDLALRGALQRPRRGRPRHTALPRRAGVAILNASPIATDIRTDMRERVRKLVPEFHDENARRARISREDIARATKRAFDGAEVGPLPGARRPLSDPPAPRAEGARGRDRRSRGAAGAVRPLDRDGAAGFGHPGRGCRVGGSDHRPLRSTACRHGSGSRLRATFPTLRASVLADFEAIELPPGYQLFWDGEQYSTERPSGADARDHTRES